MQTLPKFNWIIELTISTFAIFTAPYQTCAIDLIRPNKIGPGIKASELDINIEKPPANDLSRGSTDLQMKE